MRILGEPEKGGQQEPLEDGSPREGRGGSRRMFLVAILIILALFGYLYFFTDMIRSHKEPQQEAELLVRKPLPRKGGPMGAMTTSRIPAVTPGTPAPPPVKAATAKPVPQVASTIAKPQPQKVAPPAVPPVKPAARPESAAGSEGKYVVLCGPFVSTREQVTSRSAIKKAGLTPVSSPGPKQPTLMYRLFVAGYSDASVAANERNKLLESTPDAFVLLNDGNYELFAGSYHEEGRAVKLRDRLAARGIKAELRQVTAPVATRRLSAGAFPTQEAAGAVAERLKKDGIACIVIKRGH